MAALTPSLAVLSVVFVLGCTSLPNCTLRCNHKTCSKGRVHDNVCRSLALTSGLKDTMIPFAPTLIENTQSNMLIIKWRKNILPQSGNAMLYIPLAANASGLCFNVTINLKKYKHTDLRLRCTDADTMDLNRMLLLSDEDAKLNPIAVNEPMPEAESAHEPDKKCDCWSVEEQHQGLPYCWSPGWVQLNPIKNKSMEVDVVWNPCNTSREILVMIGRKGSDKNTNEAIIPTYKLRNCLHSKKFTIKEPGEYEAWVGALGCESPNYAKSAALQVPYKPRAIPESEVFQATTTPDMSSPPSTKLIVVLVGAFTFIGSIIFGLACFIKRRPRAPLTDPETEPLTGKPKFQIVVGSEEREVKTTADILRRALPNSKLIPIGEIAYRQPSMNEIQMLVLLQDIHAQEEDRNLRLNRNRTVLLQLDFTRSEVESPLVVQVPEVMDHPRYSARNNQRNTAAYLSLSDFLQRMEIQCSPSSPEMTRLEEEMRQLSRHRRDEIKKVLLISGFDDQFHRNACLELANLVRMVGKTVIDPYDDVNRKVMMEHGPLEWTMKQIKQADLVLIVGSEVLYKVVDCYEREEASESMESVGICAPLCLKQLTKGYFNGKTALVTLGYGSGYLNKIIDMHPQLHIDMRYSLVESKPGAFQEEQDESHALRLFLYRMSSNRNLVDDACASEHCGLFFRNIQQMAAVMAEGPDWLENRYGSMESFQSLMTISQQVY